MKLIDIVRKLPAFREAALREALVTLATRLLGPALRGASDVVLAGVSTDNLDDRLDAMLLAFPSYHIELPEAFQTEQLVELAYDPDLPLPAREAFVKVMHGMLAAIVIARAVETDKRVALPVATNLAASVAIGLKTLGDGVLAIVPAYLAGGLDAVEKRFERAWKVTDRYRAYLEGFFPRL